MSGGTIWAVVPVKPFHFAKQRLAPILSADERAMLARMMFEDVLSAVTAATGLAGTIVVSRDPAAAAIAQCYGAVVLQDARDVEINTAVRIAAEYLRTVQSDGMMVVPADIPGISPLTIVAVIERLSRRRAVVAIPAIRDGGTNLLACRPVDAIAPNFGHNSFYFHREAARQAGIEIDTLPNPEAGLDIDCPDDLAAFMAVQSESRTRSLLLSLDLKTRLQHGLRDQTAHPGHLRLLA